MNGMKPYDVVVVGLGVMGSAALAQLASRGLRVLGVEQFALGHSNGSSHGHSRIIRTAYYEDPVYVPLVRRSFELWRQLERDSNQTLLVPHPCLTIGDPAGELIQGVRRSAAEHRLAVEELSSRDIERRFPAMQIGDESRVGLWEHDAGVLLVEPCVKAFQDQARTHGAQIRAESPIGGIDSTGGGWEIRLNGRKFSTREVILTTGPWTRQALPSAPLTVMRQTVHWTDSQANLPIFLLDSPGGAYYGLPAVAGKGVKVARHYGAPEQAKPDASQHAITSDDVKPIQSFIDRHLPSLGPVIESRTCWYTLTPDRHFIIDRYGDHPSVIVAAGFSGHGFKFAPVVGEIVADLAMGRVPMFDLKAFSAKRFN